MQITDILSQIGGIQSIARELGVSENEAETGAAALIPAILGGFKKQAQAPSTGLDGLGGLLSQLGGGGLLESVLSPQPTDVTPGNDVLGQIFGSKDVSRTVAQHAATRTGLDPTLLKKMLPLLVILVAGYMAKRGGDANSSPESPTSGGGLGGLLGGLLRGRTGGSANVSGASLPGLGSLLDVNGDGNPLDDILKMAGKAFR